MPTVHFVSSSSAAAPATQAVACKTGETVMQAAVAAGLPGIAADCGGLLTCATCHVLVAPDWTDRLEPPSADELGMLDFTASPRQPGSRLCCQITMTEALDGLTVTLPPSQY